MTKAELLKRLENVSDDAIVFLSLDGYHENVECTAVNTTALSENEPVVILE